jgi:hypothetical protein
VPIKGLLRELCLFALVFMVEDFFTSQRCSRCCLRGQKERGGNGGGGWLLAAPGPGGQSAARPARPPIRLQLNRM